MRRSHFASFICSFPRSRVAEELLIPRVVVLLGPGTRHVAANDGAKSAAFHRSTHIDVDDKKRDGGERAYGMYEHSGEPQETQVPGNVLGEPQNQAGKQKQDAVPKEAPKQQLLAGVETIGGRNLIFFVANVMSDGGPPGFVGRSFSHLPVPHAIHQRDPDDEHEAEPRMQLARSRCPTEDDSDPKEPGAPEG